MSSNMSNWLNLRTFAAGAIAIATVSLPVFVVAAGERTALTTEFSAQTKEDPKNKGKGAGAPAPVKQAPANVVPRQHVAPQGGGQRNFGPPKNIGTQKNIETQKRIDVGPRKNFGNPNNFGGQKNINTQKKFAPVTNNPQVGGPGSGGSKSARRVFAPRGTKSGIVNAARIRNAPAQGAFRTSIRGRNYSLWRSGYRARYRGGWRTFVGLSALGILAIGAYEYYPYAYVDAPEDYCDGRTEDGCQLVYDDVETTQGDMVGQCVAYCPR